MKKALYLLATVSIIAVSSQSFANPAIVVRRRPSARRIDFCEPAALWEQLSGAQNKVAILDSISVDGHYSALANIILRNAVCVQVFDASVGNLCGFRPHTHAGRRRRRVRIKSISLFCELLGFGHHDGSSGIKMNTHSLRKVSRLGSMDSK